MVKKIKFIQRKFIGMNKYFIKSLTNSKPVVL